MPRRFHHRPSNLARQREPKVGDSVGAVGRDQPAAEGVRARRAAPPRPREAQAAAGTLLTRVRVIIGLRAGVGGWCN